MKFFEVFHTLVIDEKDRAPFTGAEVTGITNVKTGDFLRVRISSEVRISLSAIEKMESAIKTQVLGGSMAVKIVTEDPYEYEDSDNIIPEGERPASQGDKPKKTENKDRSFWAGKDGKKGYTRKKKKTDEGMLYGHSFDGTATAIYDIITDMRDVIIEGEIFGSEVTVTKTGLKILRIDITDNEDSISAKIFLDESEEALPGTLKNGLRVALRGRVEYDQYEGELMFAHVAGIKAVEKETVTRVDTSDKKRVELHLHTQFSDMDACTDIKKLINRAADWGHRAVAITDHGVVQGFPVAFHAFEDVSKKLSSEENPLDFKVIFGCEGYLVDDSDDPIVTGDGDVELIRSSALDEGEGPYVEPSMQERISKIKSRRYNHVILLAANETGRINLYRLVSYAHVNYFSKRPRIPRSVLQKYREGIIVGSACVMG
ncbi:MAG: PHP domain-containing protein, partial [Parasporobacterium sp.]|nr:PHP domain-containing protein [Parasporobacterium sp.]